METPAGGISLIYTDWTWFIIISNIKNISQNVSQCRDGKP